MDNYFTYRTQTSRKNRIDKLFQDKLKNLAATPHKRVWAKIESKLGKKKPRVLLFWWFAGGIAALFLLGIFIFPFSENRNHVNINHLIISKKVENKNIFF